MALKSIYKELLDSVTGSREYNDDMDMDMTGSYLDGIDDIMAGYDDDSNLAYLPIKRHFIEQCGLRYDISSIISCSVKDRIPKTVLDGYIDGKYFNDYPVAVSFLMRRDDYLHMQRETNGDGLYNILRFSHGMHTIFSQGRVVSVYGDADSVTVIAGFSKEGDELDD